MAEISHEIGLDAALARIGVEVADSDTAVEVEKEVNGTTEKNVTESVEGKQA